MMSYYNQDLSFPKNRWGLFFYYIYKEIKMIGKVAIPLNSEQGRPALCLKVNP